MILNRSFYDKISRFKAWIYRRQVKKLVGEKRFKDLRLHKTAWPDKLYLYSPRFKKVPRFTGNLQILSSWKDSKSCEMICPTHAIKVTASAVVIDDRGCIACGLCVEVAPKGLLEMPQGSKTFHRS
jgi:NAD-dependent dihydropyrimidine dehydrogenase PreA subunit